MIGMMGLRGVTLLHSSGDSGVGAPCRANDGSNRAEFTPQFPGTCTYITAVGGTQAYNPEIAWVGSSGGFSNYFSQAWYQKEAIATYLDKHVSAEVKEYYKPYANFTGRGFPDISAHSLPPP
jgi:tripeptidyl-peptidase I